MAEIKKIDGRPIIDYMARDYESILNVMRAQVPYKLPEWKDYQSEADFGNVMLQLFAHMGDILSYYQDRVANESFLGTAQSRRSIIQHLRLIGYRLSTAAPASAVLTVTVPATASGTVTIRKGAAFATKSQQDKPSVRFEYTGDNPLSINVSNTKTFRIPVEEGRLIANERLGASDGTPNQRFRLGHTGLILRSFSGEKKSISTEIDLVVRSAQEVQNWNLCETLAFSREKQHDYCIDIDENDVATIVFGDNSFGAIPGNGYEIFATYRVGGGTKGNVAAKTITSIIDAPKLALVGATVTNEKPATGGADRETLEHAVMHAPAVFRSLKRAVTAEDYEALALNYKGVGKVRAKAGNWNTVNLFVAPEGGGSPSDVLQADLLSYFEDKRPVSTIIEVQKPEYRKIYISATLNVDRSYIQEDVKEKVIATVAEMLAFANVDFAQPLYLSRFYDAIQDIEGVKSVSISQFRTDIQRLQAPQTFIAADGTIQLSENEIPMIPDGSAAGDNEYIGGIQLVSVQGGVIPTDEGKA